LEIYLSELETMLDKLSLEDLERIVAGLSVAKVSNQDKQKVLNVAAQNLVREGLANTESLTQFGVGMLNSLFWGALFVYVSV
jgi:hypothetical protein